jgi:erlin
MRGGRMPRSNGMEVVLSIVLLSLAFIYIAFRSVHQVQAGNVGVFYRAGRLQSTLLNPGYNIQLPFLDRVEEIPLTFVTEKVSDIPCGVNGGVTIYFDLVEVVHRLRLDSVVETIANYTSAYADTWIVDRLHHEMNQYCSVNSLENIYIKEFEHLDERLMSRMQEFLKIWAPGIDLISLRVTKPVIPDSIMEKYSEVSNQQSLALIKKQQRDTILKKAEVDGHKLVNEARKELSVAKIRMEQMEKEATSRVKIEQLANDMFVASAKQEADSWLYAMKRKAKSNQVKLTPAFLEYTRATALTSNLVLVHGENIPEYLLNP